MIKRFTLILLPLLLSAVTVFSQTTLEGKVTDNNNGDPIGFADVALYLNGNLVTGAQTDFDGNYRVSNIDAGTYDVEASYLGMATQRITGVIINSGNLTRLNFKMEEEGVLLNLEVVVKEYRVPLIDKGNTSSGKTITSEEIRNLPTKNINALAGSAAGISSVDGGDISIRGSRTNQTNYYIDGVRVSNASLIPSSEIDQLQVLTGGIGAQYGDVTGGVISITTKGPSSSFSGGIEAETSEYLDAFGYNLINGNVSGPIIKKNGKSLLGFRFSGQYRYRKDDDPPATGVYVATEEKINELEEQPLFERGGTALAYAELLKEGEGVELLKYRPNEQRRDIDLTGKLDAKLSNNLDITLSGTYGDVMNRFDPGSPGSQNSLNSVQGVGSWRLLNWVNNPIRKDQVYRGNFRIRHKLGKAYSVDEELSDEDKAKKASLIQNAAYTLRFGYEKRYITREDIRHEDNYFDYGHIGSFDRVWDTLVFGGQHIGYQERLNGFTAGDENTAWANYNNIQSSASINSIFNYNAYNGAVNDVYNTAWKLYTNVGGVYNRYNKDERDRYSASLKINFDIVPFGSEKGAHSITIGGDYEQRIERFWEVRPIGLWTAARLYSNSNITGLDTIVVDTDENGFPIFRNTSDPDETAKFYKSIRELIYGKGTVDGNTEYNYVNTDNISPDQLNLGMFSAEELANQSLVNFYGFDYLGNKVDNNVKFEEFFELDSDGRRKFLVAPFQPTYGAVYLQDRFNIKDIIFNIGLRIDYYDANNKVLKDNYSLYPINGADEFHSANGSVQPETIGDDFSVYVTEKGGTSVLGYRDGDTWYDASGAKKSSGRLIFGEGGLINPSYKGEEENYDLANQDFDSDLAFEDYKPQINWMPRLGFSFPISDDANFFAHYDVLVSRPLSGNIATAYDYFYWNLPGRTALENPNLKPVKTVDYEVGFQQKLNNSSAIKLSMYYKEFRDLIQRRTLLFTSPAPINSYAIYDNLDFGTSKGFNIQYDMRRTGNLQMTVAYTLGFADGTGSDANSQQNLISRGFNLRTLSPLSYDERHRVVATVDYRYGSGKRYNGPRVMGKDILANTGINVQSTGVSGRPFTKQRIPTRFGGRGLDGAINGSRLPWSFTIDMKIDKRMKLFAGEDNKGLNVNIYFRVQNVLDARNIVRVYSASGAADSDGYLQSKDGLTDQSNINAVRSQDLDNFLEIYSWRLLNANNFSLPRRIFVGAIVDF